MEIRDDKGSEAARVWAGVKALKKAEPQPAPKKKWSEPTVHGALAALSFCASLEPRGFSLKG